MSINNPARKVLRGFVIRVNNDKYVCFNKMLTMCYLGDLKDIHISTWQNPASARTFAKRIWDEHIPGRWQVAHYYTQVIF